MEGNEEAFIQVCNWRRVFAIRCLCLCARSAKSCVRRMTTMNGHLQSGYVRNRRMPLPRWTSWCTPASWGPRCSTLWGMYRACVLLCRFSRFIALSLRLLVQRGLLILTTVYVFSLLTANRYVYEQQAKQLLGLHHTGPLGLPGHFTKVRAKGM